MRGACDTRLARRPGRGREARGVQQEQQGGALAAGQDEVEVARQPRGQSVDLSVQVTAGEDRVRDGLEDPPGQPVAQTGHAGSGAVSQAGDRVLGGLRERRRPGRIEGAGAHAALLSPAVQEGQRSQRAAEDQRTDAHGSAHLVRGDAERIDAQGRELDRHLSQRLHRVRVDGDAVGVLHPGDLRDGLHRADLVVRQHDGHETHGLRVPRDRVLDLLRIHPSLPVDAQPLDGRAQSLQVLRGLEDRVVLDRGHEHARAPRVLCMTGGVDALDRQVVRLRPAGREHDLGRLRADGFGQAPASGFEADTGGLPLRVLGRGIADPAQLGGVGGQHLVRQGRGGRVVEVGAHSTGFYRLAPSRPGPRPRPGDRPP